MSSLYFASHTRPSGFSGCKDDVRGTAIVCCALFSQSRFLQNLSCAGMGTCLFVDVVVCLSGPIFHFLF